jgi:hypothetical protein
MAGKGCCGLPFLISLNSCMCLQTKQDKAAKGITAEEWKKVMEHIQEKADSIAQTLPGTFDLNDPNKQPIYSYDHAPWHDSTKIAEVGILEEQLMPVPPRSPDFQKAIEHIFGTMQEAFYKHLYKCTYQEFHTIDQYKNWLHSWFMNNIKASSVQRDVNSLKALYQIVKRKKNRGGLEGGFPSKKYR